MSNIEHKVVYYFDDSGDLLDGGINGHSYVQLISTDINTGEIISNSITGRSKADGVNVGFYEAYKNNELTNTMDGVIDANDTQFDLLKVWDDENNNAVVDAGELTSLADNGIERFKYFNNNLKKVA